MGFAETLSLGSYEGVKVLNYETFLSPKQVAKTRNFFWGLNASGMCPSKFDRQIDDVRFGSGKSVDPTNLFTDDAILKFSFHPHDCFLSLNWNQKKLRVFDTQSASHFA